MLRTVRVLAKECQYFNASSEVVTATRPLCKGRCQDEDLASSLEGLSVKGHQQASRQEAQETADA